MITCKSDEEVTWNMETRDVTHTMGKNMAYNDVYWIKLFNVQLKDIGKIACSGLERHPTDPILNTYFIENAYLIVH